MYHSVVVNFQIGSQGCKIPKAGELNKQKEGLSGVIVDEG